MNYRLIVLSNAVAGRDEEFNDWYTHVHVRDVMQAPGAVAVQRFAASAQQLRADGRATAPAHRYLALYEIDNLEAVTQAHSVVFTPAMPISDSFRFDDCRQGYYDPVIERVVHPDVRPSGALILERLVNRDEGAAFINDYVDGRFRSLLQLRGVVAGMFVSAAREQMLPVHPDNTFMALYWTSDPPTTLAAWADFDAGNRRPAASISISCYEPIMARLRADEARNPDAASRARSARARAALGDHVYRTFPEGSSLTPPQ